MKDLLYNVVEIAAALKFQLFMRIFTINMATKDMMPFP